MSKLLSGVRNRTSVRKIALVALSSLIVGCGSGDNAAGDTGAAGSSTPGQERSVWVNAYYPGWTRGVLFPSEIDFSAISRLIHFSWVPVLTDQGEVTLDDTQHSIPAVRAAEIIEVAHAANTEVSVAVGGAGTLDNFAEVIAPEHQQQFAELLVEQAVSRGYDGIDIDMEPIPDTSTEDFVGFIEVLRSQIDAVAPQLSLTAAVLASNADLFARLNDAFDQINIMTYDMSGAWPGWETWHNAPLSTGELTFRSTGKPLPSAEVASDAYVAAGVEPAKLGIGIDFSGYIWWGADAPNQSISGVDVEQRVPYTTLMEDYYSEDVYHWHEPAQAPYLSLVSPQKGFVTYDDATSVARKIDYVQAEGLGGVIIWQLSNAYFRGRPEGERHPLLQAAKDAAGL